MEERIFDLIVQLEDDLVLLYKKMSNISHYDNIKDVFELMVKQSSGHSMRIKKIDIDEGMPKFNVSAILELHNLIKERLFNETIAEKDYNTAIKKLANAEEIIGKLYQKISEYYKKVSEYYNSMSFKLEELSKEEFDHRDIILKRI